ncbi:MAG TPA: TIM barrel protein [Terriglobia bacterium]|nr:TIM barrel protein [Terriglobia bacterium]
MSEHISRRSFLQSTPVLAGALALSAGVSKAIPVAVPSGGEDTTPTARGPFRGTLCLFSKPVPQLNWAELAQSAKRAGFGGIDLTVRPGGHVLPERVTTDLPQAVSAIRSAGLEVPMITTELHSADDPAAEPILTAVSKLSIPFLKPGYYHYKFVNVLAELEDAGRKFQGLVKMAGEHGIQVGYHNHDGYIGAPTWDMARVIEPLDSRWCGYYFDLSQATTEGGVGGWKIAANLVMPRLKMIAAKDFVWKQAGQHRWEAENVPLGQGMAHWKEFVQTLAHSDFHGPITIHEEYSIPGVSDSQGIALSRDKVPEVMAAAKTDLDYLKSLIREAYSEV